MSVKQELEIGKTLYPPGKVPDDLLPKTRREIRIRVFGFLALYWLLGSVSGHVFWASLILTVIACNDFRTRFNVSSNILRTFDDTRYQPDENERGYQTIVEKRKVARWYLSALPTRTKEGLTAVGYFGNVSFTIAAYITLIGTLALNELVTLCWRIDRFRRLIAVDRHRSVSAAGRSAILGG